MPQNPDIPAEVLLVDENSPAIARQIRRQAASGKLRRLYAGVYTANLDAPPESVVLRNWRRIVEHLLPGGVISHRSAFEGRPHEGRLIVTRGRTRRDVSLPGLEIQVMPGASAQAGDVPYGKLYLSGEARRFLENLARGRASADRVLPQADVEAALERILAHSGERGINLLRESARGLAGSLGYEAQFGRLDGLIGALLGTREANQLTAKQALARAAGRPYDPRRLKLFDELFTALHRTEFTDYGIADPAPNGEASENFAFFEAYFSNYIEGTTFTVEEAEDIVFHNRIIENRTADSHDILGTFAAATSSPWRDTPPTTADDFLDGLRKLNALVMQRRADKRPGEWKEKSNQAGATVFVTPELVQGTLREGFVQIQALAHPFARAVMTMFVIAEVHPFQDGNGRTARLAMNAHLTAAGLCRIIVPTVYRDDYLSPLKALSHNADTEPLIRALTHIHEWSASFDYGVERSELRDALARCNAFQEDLQNYRLQFPEKETRTATRPRSRFGMV